MADYYKTYPWTHYTASITTSVDNADVWYGTTNPPEFTPEAPWVEAYHEDDIKAECEAILDAMWAEEIGLDMEVGE